MGSASRSANSLVPASWRAIEVVRGRQPRGRVNNQGSPTYCQAGLPAVPRYFSRRKVPCTNWRRWCHRRLRPCRRSLFLDRRCVSTCLATSFSVLPRTVFRISQLRYSGANGTSRLQAFSAVRRLGTPRKNPINIDITDTMGVTNIKAHIQRPNLLRT